MSHTRRRFLQQVSAAAAAGVLTQLSSKQLWALAPARFIPEPDEPLLRDIARKAMDAARASGASYADIRLNAARYVEVSGAYIKSQSRQPMMHAPAAGWPTGYGIRAIVNGAWGWAAGNTVTPDAVVQAARTAVAVARANKPRRPRTLALAPAEPVPDGVWVTPIIRDPLAVPIGEQADLVLAALAEASTVREVTRAYVTLQWRRPTCVFASTEGTSLLFRHATAVVGGNLSVAVGDGPFDSGHALVEGLRQGPFGYEALSGHALVAGMRSAAERAIEAVKRRGAPVSVELGRYDLVFGPDAVRTLIIGALTRALNAEFALGYLAEEGISFAAPPLEMLGTYQLAAPLITLRGDRTRRGGAANVPWDDEGVKPRDYTFIQGGVIVDYHHNRQTAAELGAWYASRGEATRAQGLARGAGTRRPGIYLPNITLEPGREAVTVEDMIRDVKKGLYVEDVIGDWDQQAIDNLYHGPACYIHNGKFGKSIQDMAFQFTTTRFWKSVDAIGGTAAVSSATVNTVNSQPDQPLPFSTVDVVPLRVRKVNVLNTGRTA